MREADAMSDTEIRKSFWSTSQRLIRKQLALLAARASAGALRSFKLGQGQSLPGKIALKIDPEILSELVRTIDVVLVSGTNGKTTTTALLASGLERSGHTVTNVGGSNMTGGVVSALIDGSGTHSMARFAALEVDEIYLTPVARAIKPKAIILLNLSRDQLDRTQEVRKIAARWKSLLSELPGVKVVANADDPLVVFAASEVPDVTWVAGGISWTEDSSGCPVCTGRITFSGGSWQCHCGFQRPEVTWQLSGDLVVTSPTGNIALELNIPGSFNIRNSLMALAGCACVGVAPEISKNGMAGVVSVSGRFQSYPLPWADGSVMLTLAKNPAGWVELIAMVDSWVKDRAIVIGLNAKFADGKDPSWIWDVPFEIFAGHSVVVCGERATDMALRLRYAEVEALLVPDAYSAIVVASKRNKDVVVLANYTCFQRIRKDLERSGSTAGIARALYWVGGFLSKGSK
ncbi:MAG: DUF1727 domain-containing protein [Acidimicrobiaceae bacterium]|nr:DUF1727 domain-containing protein [Acidimicrobiaceae bacterium]